jgi:hypothetical protein
MMRLEPGKKQLAWPEETPQTGLAEQQEPKASSALPLAPREFKPSKPSVSPVKRVAEAIVTARPSQANNHISAELFASLSPKTVASSTVGDALQLSLPDSTLQRLVQGERFTKRLETIIEEYHQPEAFDPDNVDANDLRVALTALDRFDHISLIAGAMWNGEALRTTLQKTEIREMVDLLGRETLAYAIMNALQPPSAPPSPKPLEAIRSDGVSCFFAWASSIPKGLRQRMDMRQPSLFHHMPELTEAFLASGPLIMRKAAEFIVSSSDE